MKLLLEAGVHFGHQTKRWNPKMKQFIFTERNGIHIIDLQQTVGCLSDAYNFVRDLTRRGENVLFVGTKKQAQEAIEEEAKRSGQFWVNQRWLGGMLTNFQTIQARVRRLQELKIRAPGPAVIESLDLQPGDLVGLNVPVMALVDHSNLWVRAYVPENRLNIQLGQAVEVSTDSYPGERFPATITFIARQAEFTPGNVQTPEERSKQVFRIKVDLDEGLDVLRPGMSADVLFD